MKHLFIQKPCRFVLFVSAMLSLAAVLQAQDAPDSADDEDYIVIDDTQSEGIIFTATRGEKSVKDAPGAVTVITKEEIDERPVAALRTLLDAIPGFYTQQGDSFSVFQSSTVRGIASDRISFMLDGMPIKDPRTGDAFIEGISTSSLERVEAVRGPMSALYGSGLAGAVNFITRMPEKREFTVKGDYGNPFVNGEGNANAWTAYVSYGDKLFDRLSVLLGYNRKQTDGFPSQFVFGTSAGNPPYEETATNAGVTRYKFGDYGDKKMFDDAMSVKLQYELNDATLIKAGFIRTEVSTESGIRHDLDGTPVYGNSDPAGHTGYNSTMYGTAWGRVRYMFQTSAETMIANFNTKLAFGILDTPDYYQLYPTAGASTGYDFGPGYVNDTVSRSYSADWQVTAPEFFRQIFTVGLNFEHETADSAYFNLSNWKDRKSKTALRSTANALSGGKSDTWAFYAQDEIRILENLTVYVGGRFDWWKVHDGYTQDTSTTGNTDHNFIKYDERSSWAFSPKAAVVYSPVKITTLRVSGGRAFSAPSIYELFSSWNATLANPDLDPETVWSWDASVTQDIFGIAQLNFGYFANYMQDFISSGGVTVDGVPHARFNVGKAEAWGFETGLGIKFLMFTFKTDYTYTHAVTTEDKAAPDTEGKYLMYVPEHVFNLGIEGKYKAFTGYLGGRYVSKRWTTAANTDTTEGVSGARDPYFLTDMKLSYAVTKNFTASAAVNNMFNWEAYESVYKIPGASWTLGLEINY
jgi:iron complex outermembrane receptor protein